MSCSAFVVYIGIIALLEICLPILSFLNLLPCDTPLLSCTTRNAIAPRPYLPTVGTLSTVACFLSSSRTVFYRLRTTTTRLFWFVRVGEDHTQSQCDIHGRSVTMISPWPDHKPRNMAYLQTPMRPQWPSERQHRGVGRRPKEKSASAVPSRNRIIVVRA